MTTDDAWFAESTTHWPEDFAARVAYLVADFLRCDPLAVLRALAADDATCHGVMMQQLGFDEQGIDIDALPAGAVRAILGGWDIDLWRAACTFAAVTTLLAPIDRPHTRPVFSSLHDALGRLAEAIESATPSMLRYGRDPATAGAAFVARFPWFSTVPPETRAAIEATAQQGRERRPNIEDAAWWARLGADPGHQAMVAAQHAAWRAAWEATPAGGRLSAAEQERLAALRRRLRAQRKGESPEPP
jgi:hypothetical protein